QRKRIGDTGALIDAHVWAGDATHFVWTVNGIEVETTFTPEQEGVIYQVFDHFPEMTFLALDVVEDSTGRWYVLEANSAPTMTPKTTEKYGEFFRLFEKKE